MIGRRHRPPPAARPWLLAALAALAGPATARADEPGSDEAAAAEPASEETGGVVLTPGGGAEVEIDGRLYARWALSDEPDVPLDEFRISSARLQIDWRQSDWVEAVVELEAEEALAGEGALSLLRDAYVEVTPLDWLHLRAGQFKRAFSRLELLPLRRVATVGRGLLDDWVADDLAYAGRDLGFGLSGRLWDDVRLDYAVGVFNGSGEGIAEGGSDGFKDFSARIDARPISELSVGLSFSLKVLESGDLPARVDSAIFAEVDPAEFPAGYDEEDFRREHAWMIGTWWMAGADVALHVADLRLLVEAAFGEDWWFEGQPYTAGLVLLASYDVEIASDPRISLEPVFRGEWVSPRINDLGSRIWLATVGVNLHLGRHFRLMVDGEFIRVEGPEPDEVQRNGLWPGEWPGGWEDVNRLTVQLAFDA